MDNELRSAISSHHTDTTDAAWDSGKNVKNVRKDESAAYYAKVYAWKDSEGDVGNKTTYKFPHHVVSADGTPGDANTRACSNGISVLNGGRGGADIPSADRQGVYRHLATHLKDADKEVPELKSDSLSGVERRFVPMGNTELRADTVGNQPMIVGYAAKFNTWDGDPDLFSERIQRGAFSKTLMQSDIRCLFNHDANYLLGRKSAKTLRLWEDNIGLWMEVDINPEDPQAVSIFSKIARRDITGQSFSFFDPKDLWDFTDPDKPKRTLVEVSLVDVGPVTFPFYEVTSAEPAYRSLTRAREALKPANDSGIVTPRDIRLQEKRRRDTMFKHLTKE
jgi:HK97 family phage prohead protease